MADSDVQEPFLNVVLADTASFLHYDLREVEQNGGELRTGLCTSASIGLISVIHQAALEGT